MTHRWEVEVYPGYYKSYYSDSDDEHTSAYRDLRLCPARSIPTVLEVIAALDRATTPAIGETWNCNCGRWHRRTA